MKIETNKKWSWRSRNTLFWGFVFIGIAVLLVLNGIGVNLGYGVSVWRVILGVFCLAWVVDALIELNIAQIPFPLAFLFLIFEPTIAHAMGREDTKIISTWTVMLAALLLTIGLKVIIPDRDGKKGATFGSKTLYFDASDLSNAVIKDNVGPIRAYFTNKESYAGGGVVAIRDNVGKIDIHVPENWNVVVNSRDNIGSIDVPEQPDGVYDKTITIDVRDNVGAVKVIFD